MPELLLSIYKCLLYLGKQCEDTGARIVTNLGQLPTQQITTILSNWNPIIEFYVLFVLLKLG